MQFKIEFDNEEDAKSARNPIDSNGYSLSLLNFTEKDNFTFKLNIIEIKGLPFTVDIQDLETLLSQERQLGYWIALLDVQEIKYIIYEEP